MTDPTLFLRNMNRALLRIGGAAMLLAAPVATPSAQVPRTGDVIVPCAFGAGCDANWSVSWYGLLSPVSGVTGFLANAAIATAIPAPPWTPNTPGIHQWIGVSQNATTPTYNTGDNATRYRYFFQTHFTGSTSALSFAMGWDNRLAGVFTGAMTINVNGTYSGGTSVLDVSPYAGKSAFCRDGDGVFPSNAWPNGCLVNASLTNVNVSQDELLTIVIEGDGTTDGLLVGDVVSSNVTPEPASLALLGTGLVGLGGAAWRRRRRAA
jgi:hypothetical protein